MSGSTSLYLGQEEAWAAAAHCAQGDFCFLEHEEKGTEKLENADFCFLYAFYLLSCWWRKTINSHHT